MVRKTSLAVALALGISPLGVQALGLGEIKLKSALNQYFSADIQLMSVEEGDLEDIRVTLASQEAFNRAGVDRPFILTKLQFKPVQLPDGTSVIQLSSRDPIREPFLNFLVEVNWPKGKVLREYTVLLDPPVTLDRKPAPVQTPKASAPVASAVSDRMDKTESVVTQSDVSWAGGPAAQSTGQTAGGDYGPTKRNDTLWSIAKQVRHDGASMHQMMMALFRSNPEAFIAENINNLKVGQILRVPDRQDVLSYSQREAYNAYSRQVQEWRADRQPVQAEAPATPIEKVTRVPATGEVAAETAPGTDELKIATARAEGTGEAGPSEGDDPAKALEEVRQDLLIAQEAKAGAVQESQELKSRVTDLESQLNDLQRLLELKNDQLAQLQAAVTTTDEIAAETPAGDAVEAEATDEAEPAAEAVDETQTPQAVVNDAVEPEADLVSPETAAPDEEAMDAKPAEVEATTEQAAEETAPVAEEAQPAEKLEPPKPVILPTPKAEPSLYDRVMGDTTLLGGIIGGIVVFLALIWVWISRRRNSADFQESILVSTIDDDDDQIGSPEVTSQTTEETSFLSDFSPSDIDALQDETGEVDPLAEADVYIAYGRYQQAEELVRQAIDKDPERLELKHKLAEILFATKDKDAYLTLAEELKSAGTESKDSALWGKIVSMGTQLAPGAALFAGAASASDDLGLDDLASIDDALDEDLSDEFNLDDFDANSSVSDETVQANRSDLDFDMDLGLDELNKGLGEDDTNISGGMGGLSGLSGDKDETDIDLGLNLDEETTALDLDEVEKLETAMDDVLSSTDLDEDTDINFSAEQESRDLGAFDEPTSEVVQLKIGDPSDDAEVADLANENDLDFGDLGDLDVDLSTFQKGADGADNLTTDLTDELESTLDEDSYSLDDLELGEDLDIPVAEEEDTGAEDEVSTKIDLARAYIDMGDPDGARDILGEVMDEGSDSQKQQAQALLDSLA
mgnify:FL=1